MKQAFLNSLVGLSESNAIALCAKKHYPVVSYEHNAMIMAIAHDGVILWMKDNKVSSALPADPTQLEK